MILRSPCLQITQNIPWLCRRLLITKPTQYKSKRIIVICSKFPLMLTIAVLLYPENAHIALNIACRLSKEGKRVIYCIYEYEPLLDSCNMTIDDYARLATDISVSDQRRIQDFPEGASTPKRGALNYYFVQFSWKQHKNEEKWEGGGSCVQSLFM